MLFAWPLHGHITHLVLHSTPHTLSKRYVVPPTSVSVLSATSDVAVSSRGIPSRPAWPARPHPSFGTPRLLVTVHGPPFSTHLLHFPRHDSPLMLIALGLCRRSWRLATPSFVPRLPLEGFIRPSSPVTRCGSSECMLFPWPSCDSIACFVFRPSLVIDPISASASVPFVVVVPSKSVWPSWPR